jgi:heme A synthase
VPSGTSVQANVEAMAVIVVAAIVVATLLITLRRGLDARLARPHLPADDRPPAGLGRLVPVGAQVEDECRRGMAALEHWLLSHRQAGREGT